MRTIDTFTEKEVASLIKISMAMVKADGRIDSQEMAFMTALFNLEQQFEGKPNLKEVAENNMPWTECFLSLSNLSAEQKRYVGAFLGSLMAADGDCDIAEQALWAFITNVCHLPELSIDEAIDIIKEQMGLTE